jgi:hypothetical protein
MYKLPIVLLLRPDSQIILKHLQWHLCTLAYLEVDFGNPLSSLGGSLAASGYET